MKSTLFALLVLLTPSVRGATYQDAARGFSFEYDEGHWTLVPDAPAARQEGPDVDRALAQRTLVNLQRNQSDEKYHSRFSVVAESLENFKGTRDEQWKAYQEHALKFLKSQRFQDISSRKVTLPRLGSEAFEIIASQRDFGLTFRQVVFLRGNEAYLMTAAARKSKFDSYQLEFNRVFESFSWKLPPPSAPSSPAAAGKAGTQPASP